MRARGQPVSRIHACARAASQSAGFMHARARPAGFMHASERAYRIQKKIQQSVSGSVAKWLIVFQHCAAWPKQIS
jgi:hypothetical protein